MRAADIFKRGPRSAPDVVVTTARPVSNAAGFTATPPTQDITVRTLDSPYAPKRIAPSGLAAAGLVLTPVQTTVAGTVGGLVVGLGAMFLVAKLRQRP